MTRRLLSDTIQADQWQVGPLFFVVLFLALIIGIRTLNGAFLPMLTGGISILWTLGFMSILEIPINMLTWVVPYLVFILGSTEDMHILSEYRIGVEHHQNHLQAIAYMAEKTGLAVLLTGLTTFLGFLSIMVNEITLLRQFSMAAAFALFVNPIITVTVAPVYLRFFGRRNVAPEPADVAPNSAATGIVPRLANTLIYLVDRQRLPILGILLLATPVMLVGIFSLKVDNDLIGYFTKSSDLRVRSQQLHDELSGMQNFFIVLQADHDGAFKEPKLLQTIFAIQQRIENLGRFDSSLSLADHVALIHREMSDADPKSYRIPDHHQLIAQYLLLFTREDLERYVSADFRQANIHVRHNLSSSYDLKQALNALKADIDPIIGRGLSFEITGEGILFNQAADTLATGQVYSLLLILVLIFVIMTILFVRVKAGLLALVPNIIPILFLFGIMGLVGVPLNPGTAMIAACAIGIAVDDSVHLCVRYHHEMMQLNDQRQAVMATIRGDLRPVLTTSVALALGFSILILSDLIPTIQYGLLSAVVMILALLSDLLITPILLATTKLITVWDLLGLNLTQNVIARSELFRQMSRLQIKKIVLLGHILSVADKDCIVRQGERGRTMYLILEGAVKVEHTAPHGEGIVLEEFFEGDIFGEIALVNEVERTANVIATKATRVLAIDWEALERVRKIYPRLSARLFLNLSRILGTRLALSNTRR
jgi:predicted RND superfamily exporter protein